MKEIQKIYTIKKEEIRNKLQEFKSLPEENWLDEHLFCLLTPQSNAQRCWEAIEQIKELKQKSYKSINKILSTKTRFHNNKTNYILKALKEWEETKQKLSNQNIPESRNQLAESINGYGLKEAGHFLRNIGKSNNQIAILDRHILKHLQQHNLIKETKIKNAKHYKEIETIFLQFAKQSNIPADELDLLLWSSENGEVFK
ncbi:MAG TPA: DNA lyase [Candidatus Nanoarchaeia archaeon]|nr:DNA lyase [Candidatus Nanoarchaeia archaeon]